MKKFAKLFCAVSAVLAASQTMALAPTAVPELKVYLAGASAQDVALKKIFTNLCDAGTLDVYSDTGNPTVIGNYNAYSCTIAISKLQSSHSSNSYTNEDTNHDGKLDVVVYKRSAGGSGIAASAICSPAGEDQVLVDNTCSDTGSTAPEVAGDRVWKCAGKTKVVADGGLSDLEIDKLPGATAVCDSSSAAKTLVSTPIWGTVFNTPVSTNFRDALQCVQGLQVGSETEANMPSLPKSVIASVFNGGIARWDQLSATRADGALDTLPNAVASRIAAGQCLNVNTGASLVLNTAGVNDMRTRVCRRSDSSGTNSQFRVKFLNEFCNAGAQGLLSDNTPTSTIDGTAATGSTLVNEANFRKVSGASTDPVIIETSSAGNMATCLNAFTDTTAATTTYRWAIGMQSLENNANLAKNYRYIKVDGVSPTVENVIKNRYFDWVESAWVWSNAEVSSSPAKIDFQQVLLDFTGQASDIGTLDASTFTHSFGVSGVVGLNNNSGNTIAPFGAVDLTKPVATSSVSNGSAVNSCRTQQVNVNGAQF